MLLAIAIYILHLYYIYTTNPSNSFPLARIRAILYVVFQVLLWFSQFFPGFLPSVFLVPGLWFLLAALWPLLLFLLAPLFLLVVPRGSISFSVGCFPLPQFLRPLPLGLAAPLLLGGLLQWCLRWLLRAVCGWLFLPLPALLAFSPLLPPPAAFLALALVPGLPWLLLSALAFPAWFF
ncbi:hypothetical protein Anacy_6012 (plasmid) [Anabaena cylindrica PCC 7122]|uniref:Uncharacterized protein n=1 Tax=Anabaena cylindrica (strain ATCC 27899 / PCC 7122) TaxID=272123 RepID=K9ZSF4_ANACC|nr:hypothetical protein Anacy_6012 [Anabaena cylindrica PCC 7122]BAY06821.1 hypothetical protein NIES19_61040 [Anabaena cylindrica PCC 7122]